jgi:hypothetical protein
VRKTSVRCCPQRLCPATCALWQYNRRSALPSYNQIRDMLVSGYCAHTRTHQQKALISGRVQFALPLFSISFAQASHSVAL